MLTCNKLGNTLLSSVPAVIVYASTSDTNIKTLFFLIPPFSKICITCCCITSAVFMLLFCRKLHTTLVYLVLKCMLTIYYLVFPYLQFYQQFVSIFSGYINFMVCNIPLVPLHEQYNIISALFWEIPLRYVFVRELLKKFIANNM